MELIKHSKPWISQSDRDAVDAVLASGMIGDGLTARRFETAAAEYLGLRGGVAASTGTEALFFALKALGAEGGEVVIPTFVCRALWDAVRAAGAIPVFCDIGDDWCMNAETVQAKISPRTRAVVVVHSYGISADVPAIRDLGVPVIEDCCPGLGGRIDGRPLGSFGKICVLSFYATKLLTAGEGGMIVTDDETILSRTRDFRNGVAGETLADRRRLPMSDIQAALGLSQLSRYETFLSRRRNLADRYFAELAGLPVQLPAHVRDRSIFFRFPLRVAGGFEEYRPPFLDLGVEIQRGGVDFPLHLRGGGRPGDLPVAEKLFEETLSIPLYPALTDEEAGRVIEACRSIFR